MLSERTLWLRGGQEFVDRKFEQKMQELPVWLQQALKGSCLVPTGRFQQHRDETGVIIDREYRLMAHLFEYTCVPGHRLLAYADTEDGKHWEVYPMRDDKAYNAKHIRSILDPRRCDVCHKRIPRKKLFFLTNDQGDIVVTGGDCAKRFEGHDLFAMVKEFFRILEKTFAALEEDGYFGCGGRFMPHLAETIAYTEAVVAQRGYVSKRAAEGADACSTAAIVSLIMERSALAANELKRLGIKLKIDHAACYRRAIELEKAGFPVHKQYFIAQARRAENAGRYDEFAHNCLAVIEAGKTKRFGLMVYVGSVSQRIANKEKEKAIKQATPTKGFSGAPTGKCADLGEFEVVQTQLRDGEYGERICFTCINAANEKLWFCTGAETDHVRKYWDMVTRMDANGESGRVWVTLRGTVSEVRDDIAFGKRVKIKTVRKEA